MVFHLLFQSVAGGGLYDLAIPQNICVMWKRLLDSLVAGVVVAAIGWLLTRNAGTAAAGFLGASSVLLGEAFRAYWRAVSEAERD